MTVFNPADLARWTGGQWIAPPPPLIQGLHFDTRLMKSGSGFVALSQGERNGHDFLEASMEAGASCAIVEQICHTRLPQLVVVDGMKALADIAQAHRERFRQPVIGITGSCGKTSTKGILKGLLGNARCHVTPGNWNNCIGVPMTLFGLNTDQHNFAVIEAGISEVGEMKTLSGMIQPDLAIVTHVGPAHLDGLGSTAGVAREKASIMASARSEARLIVPESVYAFPEFKALAARICLVLEGDTAVPEPAPAQYVRYYGTENGIALLKKEYPFPSVSAGMRSNAALALVAAQMLQAEDFKGAQSLSSWKPDPHRGEYFDYEEQSFYVDCYNANPASMLDAMRTFEATTPVEVKRAYVIGAMEELGTDAVALHETIGRNLRLRENDFLCLVGPEHLTAGYLKGAQAAGIAAEQVTTTVSVGTIKSSIAAFKGAVFLKGSRAFKLETLLPEMPNFKPE